MPTKQVSTEQLSALHSDPRSVPVDVIAPIDLANAYGKFHRAPALEAALPASPVAAGFAATEWRNSYSGYWLKVDGTWQRHHTARGDWQGRRKAMYLFCLSLQQSLRTSGLYTKQVTTVSIQDDTYLIGQAVDIVDSWDNLKST